MKKISIIFSIVLLIAIVIKVYAIATQDEGELCNSQLHCLDGLKCFYYDGGANGVCVPVMADYACMPGGVYMWSCMELPGWTCECIYSSLEDHIQL